MPPAAILRSRNTREPQQGAEQGWLDALRPALGLVPLRQMWAAYRDCEIDGPSRSRLWSVV
jgi:hypothetical protein